MEVEALWKRDNSEDEGKGKGKGFGAQPSSPDAQRLNSDEYLPQWLDAQPDLRHILVEAVKFSKQRSHKMDQCVARWVKLVSGLQDAPSQKAQQVGDSRASEVLNFKAIEVSEDVEPLHTHTSAVLPGWGTYFSIRVRISGADWPEEVNFVLQDVHYKMTNGRLSTARDLCSWIAQRAADMSKTLKLDARQMRLVVHRVPSTHEADGGRPLCHSSELCNSGIAEACEVEVRRKRRGGARKSSGCGWLKRLRLMPQFRIHRKHYRELHLLLLLLHDVHCLCLCNPPQNDMDLQWLVKRCTCKVVVATPDPTSWSVQLRSQALGARLVIVDGVTVDAAAFMHVLQKVVHREALVYHFCGSHAKKDISPIALIMQLRRWGCLVAPIPRVRLMALHSISRKVFLPMLDMCSHLLSQATTEYRSDAEIVLTAIKGAPSSLKNADSVLATDRKFILQAVACRGRSLKFAREDMKADIEIVMTAVAENGFALFEAAECFSADRGVVHTAISNRGVCLRFASKELKADSELVLEAVTQRGKALKHASESLKADVHIALTALANGAPLLQVAEELQIEFQQKFSFAVSMFGSDLTLQEYAAARRKAKLVQLVATQEENDLLVMCLNLQGEELVSVKLAPCDQIDGKRVLCSSLAGALSTHIVSLDLVLPSGVPLFDAEQGQTLYEILGVTPAALEDQGQEYTTD